MIPCPLDNLPNLACSAARVNFSAWVYQICLFDCFVLIQIFSGPLPVLFASPVCPNLPALFLCFVLWSSLSIAFCLSLYLFAFVWCVPLLYFILCGLPPPPPPAPRHNNFRLACSWKVSAGFLRQKALQNPGLLYHWFRYQSLKYFSKT